MREIIVFIYIFDRKIFFIVVLINMNFFKEKKYGLNIAFIDFEIKYTNESM